MSRTVAASVVELAERRLDDRGRVSAVSRRAIAARVFDHLDYAALGKVYCYEGGGTLEGQTEPCRRLGSQIGTALLARLKPGGRSLYVRAGGRVAGHAD